ncbi:hypothetical protein [Thalassorhabdomicrobium marinisediminis]|uniref:hypothetical protein n=1 Tax=Thalassorhabdomicrobium marinisediminis TaxID=2170577 RepID=UPI002491C803|nr:hypothetical protein [Thalassorhabdomicrobium marinisediminis]
MFGFLIAVIAGAATPKLETPLARPLARALREHIPVAAEEVRVLAFMIALVCAAVLCALFDAGTPLGLAVGGALGYFGQRVWRVIAREVERRKS